MHFYPSHIICNKTDEKLSYFILHHNVMPPLALILCNDGTFAELVKEHLVVHHDDHYHYDDDDGDDCSSDSTWGSHVSSPNFRSTPEAESAQVEPDPSTATRVTFWWEPKKDRPTPTTCYVTFDILVNVLVHTFGAQVDS